jgi:hypothetical protein
MFATLRAPLSGACAGWVWGTRRAFSAMAPEAGSAAASAALPPSLFRSAAPPAAGTRAKAKGHFKRASEVMAAVREDAIARTFVKMAAFRPPLPDFRVGDAVEVLYAQELAEAKPLAVKGTVVSMPRKGIDAKFTIINVRGALALFRSAACARALTTRTFSPPPSTPAPPARTWTGSGS